MVETKICGEDWRKIVGLSSSSEEETACYLHSREVKRIEHFRKRTRLRFVAFFLVVECALSVECCTFDARNSAFIGRVIHVRNGYHYLLWPLVAHFGVMRGLW